MSAKPFVMPPPHPKERRIIFENISKPGYDATIETYLAHGGYESLRKAVTMKPGRSSTPSRPPICAAAAARDFPAARSGASSNTKTASRIYIVCQCRRVRTRNFQGPLHPPSGSASAHRGHADFRFATNTQLCYIYIRVRVSRSGEHRLEGDRRGARKRLRRKNILGYRVSMCEIYVHQGAGAYICGEETSLLESLEGKRPYPRIKPPYFPAVLGLYLKPTIVNNVETICHVKHILRMGAAEYAKMGTPGDGGTRTMCVSGDVMKPGFYELPAGAVTLGELIFDVCGGLKPGRKLKAVIPGGSSAKVMRADEVYKVKAKDAEGKMVEKEIKMLDVVMDAGSLAAVGTMIGSAGVMIMDDSREMVWALNNLNQFYANESCGQCTPCREGSLWMSKITTRMLDGGGVTKRSEDAQERGG